jgi:hypothetical protein
MTVLARASSNLNDYRTTGSVLNILRRGIMIMIVITGMMQTKIPAYLLLGPSALCEPWPPLQPVSTVLYSSSSLSILSVSQNNPGKNF